MGSMEEASGIGHEHNAEAPDMSFERTAGSTFRGVLATGDT